MVPVFSKTACLLSLIASIILPYMAHARENLSISFLDVGEGDSILIQSSGQSMLIDTGNPNSTFIISNYLKKNGINNLTSLLLTHPHLDHIGGAYYLARAFNPADFYDNGQDLRHETREIYRWYQELRNSMPAYKTLKAGDKLEIGEGIISVLWPAPDRLTEDWNSNSLVLRLDYGGFSALLMGDANHFTENQLIADAAKLKADIIKIGHHGAADCCSPEFIDKVDPELSIISVNSGNVNGYPDQAVKKRLLERSQLLQTSVSGTIKIMASDNGKFSIQHK